MVRSWARMVSLHEHLTQQVQVQMQDRQQQQGQEWKQQGQKQQQQGQVSLTQQQLMVLTLQQCPHLLLTGASSSSPRQTQMPHEQAMLQALALVRMRQLVLLLRPMGRLMQ